MLRSSPVARAVIRFAIIYGLLATPWPGLTSAYSAGFRWAGNKLFGSYGERGVVQFLPLEKTDRSTDSEITTSLRGLDVLGAGSISPRLLGYLPTVEVIALILASSLPWRRRAVAMLLGLVLVHAFIYLRVALMIRLWFSNDIPWQLHHPPAWLHDVLRTTNEVINVAPTATFVIPVLIWIAVAFRYSDWVKMMRKEPDVPADSFPE